MPLWLELLVILLLTLLNGALALAELALVSARQSRLRQLATEGRRGARRALALMADPGRFLAAVQIGITLVGVLNGAFSGATLATRLGAWLDVDLGLAPNGRAIAIPLVVVAVTYLSLVVGELAPKRIALAAPERMACLVAAPMTLLARLVSPFVWLLKRSSEALLRLLPIRAAKQEGVSEEEIRALLVEGTEAGIFAPQEHRMLEGVMRLADLPVRAVMTPRHDIAWVDRKSDAARLRQVYLEARHARLLVCEGTVDHALGVVQAKDLLPQLLAGEAPDLEAAMVRPLMVPGSTLNLRLIELFRRSGIHVAVVVDEHGTTEGLVTPTDLLEAIAGTFPERDGGERAQITPRGEGVWLVDGSLSLHEFEPTVARYGLSHGDYHTVAGLVLHRLGRVPAVGERVLVGDLSFEVLDLDRRRIDKLEVRVVPPDDLTGGAAR